MIAGGIFQTPITIWDEIAKLLLEFLRGEFPVILVIVLVVGLLAWGIQRAVTWVWTEFRAEQVRQREFEAAQNLLRETNIKEQNDLWRNTIMEIETRRDENDVVHEQTLQQLTGILSAHDQQAKEILTVVRRIDGNTQPRTQISKGSSRGAG